MKANALEKIYLVPFGKPIIEPLPQEGSDADTIWSSKPYANSNAGNIEYTRTDAFVDKACEWLEDHIYEYLRMNKTWHEPDYEPKLIEDFRKAMKGE